MTSSVATNENSATETVQLREHKNVSSIQNLYKDIEIFKVDPATRRSFINKSAYAKLHRSASANTHRHSVGALKGKYEIFNQPTSPDDEEKSPSKLKDEQVEHLKTKYSPISFGYPAKPAILPKPRFLTKNPKDENSNLVFDDVEIKNIEDNEEREIVLKQSTSEESIDIIHKELSNFTMDGKPKERKRSNSFRKIFSGGLFGKDKKKKDEEKNRVKGETVVYNENMQNESSFKANENAAMDSCNNQNRQKTLSEAQIRNLEQQYAEMHVNSFNKIRQTFAEPKQDYIPMGVPKKASISDYISAPVKKYIDTSSSTSSESEKLTPLSRTVEIRRDTPPRAQETYQNFVLVKPKASIPISSERPLPNPYQTDKASPRTIERNLNRSNSKDYPDKSNFSENKPRFDETYGTVFDSLEYVAARDGEMKPVNSNRVTSPVPKSPSLEISKLKLPPNREIYDLQPRVKSPIPANRVSTDKIIATELLRSSRSPTPPKKIVTSSEVKAKPPLSPQVIEKKPNEGRGDKIVTNAIVHTSRSQTPVQMDGRDYGNIPKARSTPVDLRMSTLQLSPQKEDIRKSVEEYYWKELKKLKEQEDYDLYMLQMVNGLYGEPSRVRRSRSLSPAAQRFGRPSLSLPREGNYGENLYGRIPAPQAIPEDQTLIVDTRRKLTYDPPPNLVRNRPERRTVGTVDSLQRPIFRRGSLNKHDLYDAEQQYNKKVSFISSEAWPTKNGYTQSPPQRRLDKRESLEDEVFLPNSTNQEREIYYRQQEPLYSNRMPQYDSMVRYQQQNRPRTDSIPRPGQEIYMTRQQIRRDPRRIPPPPPKREVSLNEGVYGQFRNYQQPPPNQLYRVTTPVYSSRQNIAEPIYSPKQVTVSNKFCDIYGQIHDSPQQKTGVLMGQLQQSRGSPMVSRQPYTQQNFVRGTRLTASVNDMGRRYPSEKLYVEYEQAPMNYDSRPLPPLPGKKGKFPTVSDTESGSDASEIQRIMQNKPKVNKKCGFFDEEWNADGKSGRNTSGNDSGRSDNEGEVRGRNRNTRRDDPRRHTLGADQQYLGMAGQGGPLSRTMDLEGQPRGYPPPSNAMLFDDDPGIMSEVETSSTGFRRGGKQRSSLPVVRTPSKTLERPLGLVFLQYRNETKRALLPNEITSIDTVKALFVRSFPKQLTMEYLDSPNVKIYIHDSSKDMFYELEDLRSHLREIRDRSVLRLFESADVSGGLPMAGIGIAGGVGHFEDPSYFSEPEFDSEYQHQHIHKSKGSAGKGAPYYMGSTASLPRGATLLRTYSPAVGALPTDRLKTLPTDGYMSSPERGSRYEDPYYSQYASRSGSITPVIDEEISDTELLDDSYSLYGVKLGGGGPRAAPRSPFPPPTGVPYDATRLRVENMERQLANLTGLVQKALTQTPTTHLQVPGRDSSYRTERDRLKPAPPPKPASLSPGQYDGRLLYRDLQLTPEMYNQLRGLQKKAKDLRAEVRNLRRMSQAQAHSVRETIRDTFIKIRAMLLAGGEQVWQAGMDQERVRLSREEDLYKQEMLRLENDLSDLESTVEELRGNVINRKTRVNMSDVENMALILSKSSKTVADLKLRFPGLQDGMKTFLSSEMEKVMREEKFLKEEPERLESALRRCKKLTGTLVTLKRLASVQEQRLPGPMGDGRLSPTTTETPPVTPTSSTHSKPPPGPRMGSLVVGGDSINTPDSSQRPENALDALLDELQTFSKPHPTTVNTQMPQDIGGDPPAIPVKGIPPTGHPPHMSEIGRKGSMDSATFLPTQNLTVSTATGSLRRLHSYPSGSDTDNSPPIQPLQRDAKTSNKPPIPERNAELIQHLASGKRIPPPPPPRTSSKSPLASPTSPSLPPRSPAAGLQHIQNVQNMVENKPQSQFETATQNLGLGTLRRNVPNRSSIKDKAQTLPRNIGSNLQIPVENEVISASNSSSCESVNSQDGSKKTRKEELEQRHQELLKKQKALQDQYARLQQLQRGNNTLAVIPPTPDPLLKKTGSESNLLQKMGLQMTTTTMTGSLTNLPNTTANSISKHTLTNTNSNSQSSTEEQTNSTTNKVYETEIL